MLYLLIPIQEWETEEFDDILINHQFYKEYHTPDPSNFDTINSKFSYTPTSVDEKKMQPTSSRKIQKIRADAPNLVSITHPQSRATKTARKSIETEQYSTKWLRLFNFYELIVLCRNIEVKFNHVVNARERSIL